MMPWDEDRLAAVAAEAAACPTGDACAQDVLSLVAEVRRLREQLRIATEATGGSQSATLDDQAAVSAAYWRGVAQAKDSTLDLQAVEFKQRESRWLARIAELEGELERERRYSQAKTAGERSWQQIAESTATEHDATLALLDRAYPWLHNPYRGTSDFANDAEAQDVIRSVEQAIAHLKDEPDPLLSLPCGSCDGDGCPNCEAPTVLSE